MLDHPLPGAVFCSFPDTGQMIKSRHLFIFSQYRRLGSLRLRSGKGLLTVSSSGEGQCPHVVEGVRARPLSLHEASVIALNPI
jgi:hypothetical protein